MEIILNNNGIITKDTINKIEKVSDFIEELYTKLNKLEKNSYYCIWFKYENKYKKVVKAKLGYIYNDINNLEQRIQIADEGYIKYYIEKLCLRNLNIEYIEGKGIPEKVKIRSIRNPRGMGDDVCCDIQEMISPEIKMCNMLKLKNFYSLSFKLVNITYVNLKNEKCVEDAEKLVENSMTFSEYIEFNSVDKEKDILLNWSSLK